MPNLILIQISYTESSAPQTRFGGFFFAHFLWRQSDMDVGLSGGLRNREFLRCQLSNWRSASARLHRRVCIGASASARLHRRIGASVLAIMPVTQSA
jgi:hypothetical protein